MQLAPGLKIIISRSFLSAEAKGFTITALDREFKGLRKEVAGQDQKIKILAERDMNW